MKFLLSLFTLTLFSTGLHANALDAQRQQAAQLYEQGNYQEAFDAYRLLLENTKNSGKNAAQDLDFAVSSLRSVNRLKEFDTFIEGVIARHSKDPAVLMTAAHQYRSIDHYGTIVAGQFERGQHRGNGRYVQSEERDRVRSAQLLLQAWPLAKGDVELLKSLAQTVIMGGRIHHNAWKLQSLTDFEQLPDYSENNHYSRGASGAPVTADGQPLYYRVPANFDASANDGERWRYLLSQLSKVNEAEKAHVQWVWANFLLQQFGVQTIASSPWYYRLSSSNSDASKHIFSLETLNDSETIAQLAGGIQRFTLPKNDNYISLLKELTKTRDYRLGALGSLANIYENRRQLPIAADYWRQALEVTGGNNEVYKKSLAQIVGAWGQFQPLEGVVPEQVNLRFRNATSVKLEAVELKTGLFLDDIKFYMNSNPKNMNWDKMQIDRLGYTILHKNRQQYLGKSIKSWVKPLTPAKGHQDSYHTIDLPSDISGAYLLKATVAGGNSSYIIVWNNSAIIVKKPLKEKTLYYVADSLSGKPLANVELHFFGFQYKSVDSKLRKMVGRDHDIITKSVSLSTDSQGQLLVGNSQLDDKFQWFTHTNTGDNDFAYLGFESIWYSDYRWHEYNQTKAYAISNQPVYRPGQTVEFSAWLRQAKYDVTHSTHANREFQVKVLDPKQEEVILKQISTNDYGALADQLVLDKKAALGVYTIYIQGLHAGQFRVEEYKKPEFEVTVEAPAKPVQLGDKITATIKANYYFGAPVGDAKVKYKVMRYDHDSRWYPAMEWDWFYGPGYWWFSYNTPWHKGWQHWGTRAPHRVWWPMPHNPPELVQDSEVNINADGTVTVTIDTTSAKILRNDTDHRYEIIAEVVDQSRRTIVGRGEVLVARKPYQVSVWVDRGYYQKGDTIKASFAANTIDQKPVVGKGEVTLFRITYDEQRQPIETLVERWPLNTDAEGRAQLQIKAAKGGQHRLAYRVTNNKQTIEGAYVLNVIDKAVSLESYRFNELELIADKKQYQSGDTVKLMVNSSQKDAQVLLFLRPVNNTYDGVEAIKLDGHSRFTSIEVGTADMPNFFVEAVTVFDGKVHTEVKEIIVPPIDKMINVSVEPNKKSYEPGEQASMAIQLTDANGKPFVGSTVIAVYDKSLEYIAGADAVAIKDYFWKWRRHHRPYTRHSALRAFHNIAKKDEPQLQTVGVFGAQVAHAKQQNSSSVLVSPASSVGGSMDLAESDARPESLVQRSSAPKKREALNQAQSSQPAVKVRTNFADAAFWQANVTTDNNGKATVNFTLPENLTSWKTTVWAMGHATEVGQSSVDVVTTKPLLLRMQAPRFFIEKDEVVLSANIHNYLKNSEVVTATLELDGDYIELMDSAAQKITLKAGGEQRVDWRVKVKKEGQVTVRMLAVGGNASDAMQMQFPVYVHGMLKTDSYSGALSQQQSKGGIHFTIPKARRAEQTRLELRYSPSIAASLVDALPYLVAYPYDSTEHTLSRFLPTLLVQNSLKRTGINLESIKNKRANLNPQEIGDDKTRAQQWRNIYIKNNPVFDEALVSEMSKEGLSRLYAMQLSDGGWGWFSGWGEHSNPHKTAYVVHGLQTAKYSGLAVDENALERGLEWLSYYQAEQIQLLNNAKLHSKSSSLRYKNYADNTDAFIAMVLSDSQQQDVAMVDYLYRDRLQLSVYGKSLLALTLHSLDRHAERDLVRRNIEQLLIQDDENQTAYLNMGNEGYWWYWYGSEFEAHAYYLKLLAKVEPKGQVAPRLVKYLLNNRKQSGHWRSTQDTAVVIEAVTDYLLASGENLPNIEVDILLDGKKIKTVAITKDNLFDFDNKVIVEGELLSAGKHHLELVKRGEGSLYYNAYVSNFTLEDFITKAGLEVKVERRYYKLEAVDKTVLARGAKGQALKQKVEKYRRVPIGPKSTLKSGDLVEVELILNSKNDYEYLIVEDMKAAGFEPVDVRSGYNGNELGAYVEFRDNRVVFFVAHLARGKHSVSYRLKAEVPGKFSALPTRVEAMYAPEIRANSDENKLKVTD